MAEHTFRSRLCLLLLLLPCAALADPAVTTRQVFYRVDGDTATDIWADIESKTPVKHDGRWHVAYTKWNVNWRFWWLENTDGCEITRINTTLDVVYTLPKLTHISSLPDALSRQWNDYYTALYEHERGHKDIGVKAAIEIEEIISAMAPKATCPQLEQAANDLARNVIQKYSRIEKDYDRRTNHGLNTGVVFPQKNAGK